jgi:hypothetical protein
MVINELNKTVTKYHMKILSSKIKTMGLCGKNIQRVQIEIEGKITEQVPNISYLGHLISNEEKNMNIKLQTCD